MAEKNHGYRGGVEVKIFLKVFIRYIFVFEASMDSSDKGEKRFDRLDLKELRGKTCMGRTRLSSKEVQTNRQKHVEVNATLSELV